MFSSFQLIYFILDSAVQLARIFETTENAEKHKDFRGKTSHRHEFHFHPNDERQEQNLSSLFRHFPRLCVSLRSLWFPKEFQLPFLGLSTHYTLPEEQHQTLRLAIELNLLFAARERRRLSYRVSDRDSADEHSVRACPFGNTAASISPVIIFRLPLQVRATPPASESCS